jgi:nicotinate-nucleotide adenylyltransferase
VRRPRRIGIFGGTFDPVHNGHLKAAAAVCRRFGLARILFVPSNIPPHKMRTGMASARDRMAMVGLALRGRPRFVASPLEIRAGGTSYSIRTLRRISGLFPHARVFFIVGTDAFLEIETWKEWRSLLDESLFIVMTRPGVSLAKAGRAPGAAYADRIRAVGRAERVREDWFSAYRILLFPIEALDVSATEIRSRVRDGRPIAGLVPTRVDRYIQEHGLYGGGGPGLRPGVRFRRTRAVPKITDECRQKIPR